MGEKIKNDIRCISPEKLSQSKNIACFAMVGVRFQGEVIKQLRQYNIEIIITASELYSLDIIVDRFIKKCAEESRKIIEKNIMIGEKTIVTGLIENIDQKKYAVYTCITGDYDPVSEPEFYSEDCDYYLISDREPEDLQIYQWIDINKVVPEVVKDNRRKNRFCKINGPFIFSEYQFSIYIDGNVQIVGDIRKYTSKVGKSGISAFSLGGDLYRHALAIVNAKVENNGIIYNQIYNYFQEGMPRNYGMFNCTILVRENVNQICQKVMCDWWNEVFNYSSRDQISFTYCLWKNGLQREDVGTLGDDLLDSNDYRLTSRHHYQNKKWIG